MINYINIINIITSLLTSSPVPFSFFSSDALASALAEHLPWQPATLYCYQLKNITPLRWIVIMMMIIGIRILLFSPVPVLFSVLPVLSFFLAPFRVLQTKQKISAGCHSLMGWRLSTNIINITKPQTSMGPAQQVLCVLLHLPVHGLSGLLPWMDCCIYLTHHRNTSAGGV